MTCYVIGGGGRLGQAIAHAYADREVINLNRGIYSDWSQAGAVDKISRYFTVSADQAATVFVASGLLDPKLPEADLLAVNYQLPKNLIDGATKLGIKVITFGTVMEGLLQSKNPYVQSKTLLGEYVRSVASAAHPAIHLQMHTLYGVRQPSPFMFLGQMLSSIQGNHAFRMTSGRQLREYHHLADEAQAIRRIASLPCRGVVNLSHGQPLSLRVIAESVFQALTKDALLQLGALPEPLEENHEKIFEPEKILERIKFRDSLPGIVQYMKECYLGSEA